MENVITLGKLISLLFCSVFENSKNTRNELAHPVMETIFLVTQILSILVCTYSIGESGSEL